MASIKPPKPLLINNEIDMSREWNEWSEAYESYAIATKVDKESNVIQIANFKAVIGREAIRVINNLGLTDAERANLTTLKVKLTAHFAPTRNKTYERYQFHRIKQQQDEPFEDFLQKLREQVRKCSFASDDEFITDQIVLGLKSEETRQKLWIEDELSIEKAIKICRTAERANKQISELNDEYKVNKINKQFKCKRCGLTHGPRRCPAFNKECKKCGRRGHFESMCRSIKKEPQQIEQKSDKNRYKKNKKTRKVNALDSGDNTYSESDTDEFSFVGAIQKAKTDKDKWSATVRVGQNELTLTLDTGAQCNVLSRKQAVKLGAVIKTSSTKRLVAYNNESIRVVGEAILKCQTEKTDQIISFKIIEENFQAILGREMCEKMGFVVRVNKLDNETQKTNKIGCCKKFEYDIDFIDNPKFKIIPARKIPYAIRNQVKQELDNMVKMGVIKSISEPTPAVSPMLVVNKGKLRVCMDPTDLNKNIKRRIYPMKTVEEIAAKTNGSKYFTKLDCQKGFWQIKVSERTSKYLTFSTPWGRYCYLRMPFGISPAPEVFSEVMNKTLEGIENCEVAMDDIFIHARTSKALQDTTKRVINRLGKAGFTLNDEKCEYNKTTVKFLGHIFTGNGYKADHEKVEAIHALKVPTCVKELQRTLGMVNYLGKFINNLSELTEPLRQLLHKETAWFWGPEQQKSFEDIKDTLTKTPVLNYYNVNKPVMLSVDASSKSMGACLLQDSKPVAYATRAFTPSQQNQPQITKEALAIRFGCTKFHEYVHGKELVVESDHKPLETIFKNSIQNAPLRLQRILYDILQYSPKVIYVKGTSIPIADTLSRDCEATETESESECAIKIVYAVSDGLHERLIEATANDVELRTLKDAITYKWPAEQEKIPKIIRK